MHNTNTFVSIVSDLLTALRKETSFEEGLRCSLPVLCVFFEGIAGEASLMTGNGEKASSWKAISWWTKGKAETTEATEYKKTDQYLEIIELFRERGIEKKEPDILSLSIGKAAPVYEKALVLPIEDSGVVFARFTILFDEKGENGGALLANAHCIASLFGLWSKQCQVEKQFHDLVDFIPNPLMVVDAHERVTVWNPAMEKMTGVLAKDMLGKGSYEHAIPFYGERRPTSSNLILNPDKDWESWYLELRREKNAMFALARSQALPGGSMLIASKTCITHNLAGSATGSVHIIQDVTHEHELERNLDRTERMVRSISEFAGVGIALLDSRNVHSCNENFISLMELEGNPISVRGIVDRIGPEDRHALEALLALATKEVPPVSFEFTSILPQKGRREFKGYAQSVNYEDFNAIHFIIIDITESKAIERKKQIHQMRMYHSDRLTALGTLSAGIAHELNQPLNTIRVITDGLLYGREQGWLLDEKELYGDATMISKQIVRMSNVINNIKNFAREDRGHDLEDVDPNEAIQNVFSMIGQQLIAHNIRVDKHIEPNVPKFECQPNHLEQVIMNLVVNARQALDSCWKKDKRLWIKTGYRFGQIFIEVGDNATGIAKEHEKEIFDPFFTTKAVGQGTGLGLSISQTIISDYNGMIKAYNNSQGGATFFITIPVEITL